MVLVDTSIWIDHFRSGNTDLIMLLKQESVVVHPLIIGELACGSLKNRTEILGLLHSMPASLQANYNETMIMIEKRLLFSRGIGFIDAQLLASCLLSHIRLWTMDKRLEMVASEMKIAYQINSVN